MRFGRCLVGMIEKGVLMKKVKICPSCGMSYSGHPALSRKDDKTLICPACGVKEALDAFLSARKEDDNVGSSC